MFLYIFLQGLIENDIIALKDSISQRCAQQSYKLTDMCEHSDNFKFLLKTGCSSIDSLLCGGLRTEEITEVTGQSSAGKTQFCLSATANLVLENRVKVLYIDSTNSFNPFRFAEICNSRLTNGDATEAMKNARLEAAMASVSVEKVYDLEALSKTLTSVCRYSTKSFDKPLRLLVVDSITVCAFCCN